MNDQIETFELLPTLSDEEFSEIQGWALNKDNRFFEIRPFYRRHSAVYIAGQYYDRIDKEIHKKIYAAVFSNLPDDEKSRRLDIIWEYMKSKYPQLRTF
ncbi:MAG: hypothetical protein IJS01_10610 [Lentisphaeria bacterium]|nr:hypothetical protein [Lentisphaeria bacterium]